MLDANIKSLLDKALSGDGADARGSRLIDDAERLCHRIGAFVALNLAAAPLDVASLELACYAIQLPLKHVKLLPTGKPARSTLRDRAEQAAELLQHLLEKTADETLLGKATQILREVYQRSPATDEGKLLADAINLDDFGVIGLLGESMQVARAGGGVTLVAAGLEKREQYGYWEARLKDGFHFEPVRQIARRRLESTRRAAALLAEELNEDRRKT